jgi:hypothetical protein
MLHNALLARGDMGRLWLEDLNDCGTEKRHGGLKCVMLWSDRSGMIEDGVRHNDNNNLCNLKSNLIEHTFESRQDTFFLGLK